MTAPVSIVIPVYNGRELLAELLESIGRQTIQPMEVLVVDNGSTDGAPEVARRAGANVIAMGRNAGFAAAVNRGIREARGEAIALINSDVRLETGWLDELWRCMQERYADFVTGTIVRAEGLPELLDGTYDLICRGGCAWRAGAGRPAGTDPEASQPIAICSATAALYRRALFAEVGNFEESFESYLEDVDFGLRCAIRGKRGFYSPAAVCRHRGSSTFGQWHPRVVRLMARNQVWLIARNYPAGLIVRWLWPILIAQLLWGALALRHGCGWAWLRGKVQGLRRVAKPDGNLQGIKSIVEESERRIWDLQVRTGFDTYWRIYFRLVGLPR
jgi:GT2 family glycosyltransferase